MAVSAQVTPEWESEELGPTLDKADVPKFGVAPVATTSSKHLFGP